MEDQRWLAEFDKKSDNINADFTHFSRARTDSETTKADTKLNTYPKVHYPNDVHTGPAPSYHTRLDSRASSPARSSDDETEENYDWSGEDDLVDEDAKLEQQTGIKEKSKKWGFKRIITLLFSSLIGSTFLSGLLVTPAVLLQYYWYNPSPSPQKKDNLKNIQAWLIWAAANILISWCLAVVVDIIPSSIRFFLRVTWGLVSEYVNNRLAIYDAVKETVKPVLYVASGWASWIIIFGHIFQLFNPEKPKASPAPYTHRVSQTIEFIFFLVLVVCAQKILSHAIAFAFHRTAYSERLNSVREAFRVIETLRQCRPKPRAHQSGKSSGSRTPIFGLASTTFSEPEHFNWLSGALKAAAPRRDRVQAPDDGEDGDVEDHEDNRVKKGKMKGKSWRSASGQTATSSEPPSWPLTPSGSQPQLSSPEHRYPPSNASFDKLKASAMVTEGETLVTSAAKVLKTAVLHDARNIEGKGIEFDGLAWNINSAQEAKRIAREIYTKFKEHRRNYLTPTDFQLAFPVQTEAEAAFRVFDKDNNGDISRAEIKTTLLKVYKEQRFLSRSMRDVGVALKTLDHILLFFAFVIVFFISLSVFGLDVGDSLTSVYTVGIAASFIFKNSASSAFDSIMFLFVTHPYDTGDRCFIDEEVLVVKKMGLFATVFTRVDGTETYYFNSQLFTKFITNIRRSGKMIENVTMQVAWRTPLEKLDALETCLNEWLATEENRWFEPGTSITLQHIEFQRYLEITIGMVHNGTWQDWGLRMQRRTAFHAAVQFYCHQLGIVGYEAPLPIVYGDADNQSYAPFTPTTGRDGQESSWCPSVATPRHAAPESEPGTAKELYRSVMGFKPPGETGFTRARKNKGGRKAMMRGMGADG